MNGVEEVDFLSSDAIRNLFLRIGGELNPEGNGYQDRDSRVYNNSYIENTKKRIRMANFGKRLRSSFGTYLQWYLCITEILQSNVESSSETDQEMENTVRSSVWCQSGK